VNEIPQISLALNTSCYSSPSPPVFLLLPEIQDNGKSPNSE